MTTRVGLTGGVASGKSTVAAMLEELGAVVIDADALAREVVAKGTPGLEASSRSSVRSCWPPTVSWTGPRWAGWSSATSRRASGSRRSCTPWSSSGSSSWSRRRPRDAVVVHDIPLLAETGRAGGLRRVIVVDAPPEVQVERMTRERGWTEEDARSRIAAQASREDRRAIATHVIENTGTREDLRKRVAEVFAEVVSAGSRDD